MVIRYRSRIRNGGAGRGSPWWISGDYTAANTAGGPALLPAMLADFRRSAYAQTNIASGSIAGATDAQLSASLALAAFSDIFTFTRAGSATFVDQNGVLQTAATDVPRFDYTNARRQLLLEGSATNSIRNNSMQGTVNGSPGTQPTNWYTSTVGGITRTIVGTGTENGVDYIDIQISGSAVGNYDIGVEGTAQVAAATGQTWTFSSYLKVAAGSLTNITNVQLIQAERDSVPTFLSQGVQNVSPTGVLTRFNYPRAIANATCAWVAPLLRLVLNGAVDITLRIGLPQLEQNTAASSVIRTTSAAVTRAADNCALSAKATALLARSEVGILIQGQNISAYAASNATLLASTAAGGNPLRTNVAGNALVLGITTFTTRPITMPLPAFGAAGAWGAAGKSLSYNGSAVGTDAVVMDTTFTGPILGRASSGQNANGWYDFFSIYPFRPTDAALVSKAVVYG